MHTLLAKAGVALVATAGVVATNVCPAQSADIAASGSALRGIAASSLQSPVAYGARWRTVGLGLYTQTVENLAGDPDQDGGAGLVVGLGDPDSLVGVDAVVSSAALSRSEGGESGFGESGSFAAKIHRNLPGYTAVAVGINGFGRWGNLKHNSKESVYGVVTHFVGLGGAWGLLGSLGAGNEAYADSGDDVGAFGSLALYYTPRFSLFAEYTGRFFNAGVSIAPIRQLPATITVGVVNLAQQSGLDTEFGASLGIGFAY